jgi:hypothetical protein
MSPPRRPLQPIGNVLPSGQLPAIGRQMTLDQIAHASVVRVVTVGIFSDRGSFRDQFGRTKKHSSRNSTHQR